MFRGWVALGVCVATCAACLEPSLVMCPDDLACPAGYVCDPAHHTCLLPDQLVTCRGATDDSACTIAGAVGYCRDEVCLPISCGNGVVDPSEACDDGNLERGDGCDATCSSDERCGNGVVDAHVGETCDDGNFLDGDACDSRCRAETLAWTAEGLVLAGDSSGSNLVYDEARNEVLFVGSGTTWGWTGARWNLRSTRGLGTQTWLWTATTYAPDRQSVVLVGNHAGLDAAIEVWEWNGTEWSAVPTVSPPRITITTRAAYDRVRHALLVVAQTSPAQFWSLDLASGVWTALPPPAATTAVGVPAIAFDEARGVLVYAFANFVYEWNGVAWTQITAAEPAGSGFTLVYDPALGATVAIGGGGSTAVVRWTGAAWTALAPLPEALSSPSATYDRVRGRRVVFGGRTATGANDHVQEWTGTTWQSVTPPGPPFGAFAGNDRLVYDPRRDVLLKLGGTNPIELWQRDRAGTWTRLASPPVAGIAPYAVAYDPIRQGFVYNSDAFGTWLFTGAAWVELEPAGTSAVEGLVAMAYDPARRAMIGSDGMMTWELASDTAAWRNVGPTPEDTVQMSFAYDARRGGVVALMAESAYQLAGDQWTQTLSPGPFFTAVADARRGSVMFVRGVGRMWERRDGTWIEQPELPVPSSGSTTAYDASTGTLVMITYVGVGWILFERRYAGTGPRDTCSGADEDGDGLVDCADPDCWLTCTPACPPFASCP